MRNILIILLLILFWSCSSCNSNGLKNNSDNMADSNTKNDADSVKADNDLTVDTPDSTVKNDAESDESNLGADIDDEWERDIEIPDLSGNPYWEEYSDSDKNVAYYYYGDFDVVAQDPDEVRKLWDKKAGIKNMLECEPMPFDFCAENYPFEAQIIDGPHAPFNESYYKGLPQITYKCDALLTPGHWVTSTLAGEKIAHGMKNLFEYYINNASGSWQAGGVYLYDIEKKQVLRISRDMLSYGLNSNSLFFSSYDMGINILQEDSLYYGERFLYPLYYNFKEHKYGHMWKMQNSESIFTINDLRASDTHVLMTAYFGQNGMDGRIMYTKIGEWDKWKELTYKKETLYGLDRRAGYGDMSGQYIVYYDYDLEVQFCDLNKGDAGCFRLSRDTEDGREPFFLKSPKTVVYFSTDRATQKMSIVQVDISEENKLSYTVLEQFEDVRGMGLVNVADDFIVYAKRLDENGNMGNGNHCYYRLSDKKTFCMDGDFDKGINQTRGHSYKHMHIYVANEMIAVRDMECYCDYNPDKCPFDDYTPNPENPKKPWGFDWKPDGR